MKYKLSDFLDVTKSLSLSQNLTQTIELAEIKINEIDGYRNKIDLGNMGDLEAIQFYTDLNTLLLNIVSHISELTIDVELESQYLGYLSLMHAKEWSGLEHAVLSRVFAADQLQDGAVRWLITLIDSQNSYFEVFRSNADSGQIAFFDRKMVDPVVADVQGMRDRVFDRGMVKTQLQGTDPCVSTTRLWKCLVLITIP